MYAAADEIVKKLIGRTREEIRLDKSKAQKEVSEEEVEKSLSSQRKILHEVYSQEKLKVWCVNAPQFHARVTLLIAVTVCYM